MIKDFAFRPHPIFSLIFQFCHSLSGVSLSGYLLFGLFVHGISAFLVYFLCRNFSAKVFTALVAALLFLTSSLCWGGLLDIIDGTLRRPGMIFYLLGIMCAKKALTGGKRGYFAATVLLCFLAIAATEDTVTFPVLFLGLAFLERKEPGFRGKLPWIAGTVLACSILAGAYTLYVMSGGTKSFYASYFGWHSLQKMLVLPREVVQFLFIPRREAGFSDILWIRLLPAGIVLGPLAALVLFMPAKSRSELFRQNKSLFAFAVLWVLVTPIPYLTRPTGWTWVSRYMYFPSVGLFALCAIFATAACARVLEIFHDKRLAKTVVASVLVYLMVFGATTSVLVWQRTCLDARANWAVGKPEGQLLLGLLRELYATGLTDKDSIRLVVTRSPFHKARLESVLTTYVLPKVFVADSAGEIPADGLPVYAIEYGKERWGKLTVEKTAG